MSKKKVCNDALVRMRDGTGGVVIEQHERLPDHWSVITGQNPPRWIPEDNFTVIDTPDEPADEPAAQSAKVEIEYDESILDALCHILRRDVKRDDFDRQALALAAIAEELRGLRMAMWMERLW